MTSLLTSVLPILLLTLNIEATEYSTFNCRKVHSSQYDTKHIEPIMRLLFETSIKGKLDEETGFNRYFELAWNSQPFKEFLAQKSIILSSNETRESKYLLLRDYAHFYLSQFRHTPFLEHYQDVIMRRTLRERGIEVSSSVGWKDALAKQSRVNRERILKGIEGFEATSSEIVQAVNSIEMFLSHNSHIMTERPEYPVVSPMIIDKMGLLGFGYSTKAFNRFIGSDRHVYFKANFKRKTDSDIAVRSEYGEDGVILKRDAAIRNAFISPFIMYPYELARAARVVAPELRYSGQVFSGSSREDYIRSPDTVREILHRLGQLDLTFEDAEYIAKAVAIKKLHDLKISDYWKFQEYMSDLVSGKKDKISYFFQSEVLGPLGFDIGWEGRVPVAVPSENLRHFVN